MVGLLLCLCAGGQLSAQQVTREQLLKLFYQAQQARQAGDTEEAMTLYKRIINLSPRLPDPYQQLGDLYGADTADVRSQEKAAAFYGFYLQLKPEATDYAAVQAKMEAAKRQQAALEERSKTVAPAATPVVAVAKPAKPAPKEAVSAAEPVVPIRKEKQPTATPVRPASAQSLTGRWVSNTRVENGREAWILDVKEVDGEYWITINSKSAVRNTELFEAMTQMDIQGRMEGSRLRFHFDIAEDYDPEKKEGNVMNSVGDFLGNMLGVDVFEWKLFANSKRKSRKLKYSYEFDLGLEPYSLKGYIHTQVRDQADSLALLTNNTQGCELFRAPMNYPGLTVPLWSDEEKQRNKELRALFNTTQKQAESDPAAKNNLGTLYWSGIGTRANMKKAVDCFLSAALENTHAQLNLATLYLEGNGVEKDVEKARNWFLSAAEKGYADAYVLCGDSYIFGEQSDNNYDTALYYYDKAITAGSAFGMFRLGWLYKEGLGVKADRSKAMLYLERAMAAGYPEARVVAAELYESDGNLTKAIELLNKAAEEHDTQAMLKLSALYLRGEGVKQDFTHAKELEARALKEGMKLMSGYGTIEPSVRTVYNQSAS